MKRSQAVIACIGLLVLIAGVSPTAGAASQGRAGRMKGGIANDMGIHAETPSERAGEDELLRMTPRQLKRWALENNLNAASPSGGPNYVLECIATGTPPNTNLDCDDPILPKNEPDIVIDPEDPNHMIASANDFESCCDQFYTTFDGGASWYVGDMSTIEEGRIGSDPVTAIDPEHDVALHASLNFICTDVECGEGDVVVSPSYDGGITWEQAIEVYDGEGFDSDPVQIFNDKEWITTDTNPASPFYGRTYVTWSRFLSFSGVYAESPIWESHSDDGGLTWSPAQEISGSSPTCTFQDEGAPFECDQDQGSVPAVAPDGTVYVSFVNEQNEATWEPGEQFEEQYMVVKSTDGGETWGDPVSVVDLENGTRDYPVNVDGRRTLTKYQIRVNSRGNMEVDPSSGELFLVFSDNRNGVHDVDQPVTNTDVFMMSSEDGTTWEGPFVVSDAASDQWFPWVEVDPVSGDIGVLYHDRSTATRQRYNTTLATGTPENGFAYETVSTEQSDPTNSAFFQAQTPGCRKCATFHGDYIAVGWGLDGTANTVWTDMRRRVRVPHGPGGFTENIFFAQS
jgi:hypothetical protein